MACGSSDWFEWDDVKADANFAKHGVRFDVAIGVFLDDTRLERFDARQPYGEDRVNVIGVVELIMGQFGSEQARRVIQGSGMSGAP